MLSVCVLFLDPLAVVPELSITSHDLHQQIVFAQLLWQASMAIKWSVTLRLFCQQPDLCFVSEMCVCS